jgi:hypothetical protein
MHPEPITMYRRPQLLAAGFTDHELARMRRAGELTSVRRGVYLASPEPDDPDGRHRLQVRAAMTELAAGAVVSHASAALLHGLPTWRMPLSRVQVTRARRSGGRRDPRLHLRTAPLRRADITTADGLPITSVARTVVDLARSAPFESGVVTADAALALGLLTSEDLEEALARCKGWPGCPRARRVVAFADGRSESVGESRSRLAIANAGLPEPMLQWDVRAAGGRLVGRVDFGWPDDGVVGEFDGRLKYGRTIIGDRDPGEVVFAEKLREDDLRAQGLTVIRWTWDDLVKFAAIAARLDRALA